MGGDWRLDAGYQVSGVGCGGLGVGYRGLGARFEVQGCWAFKD